MPFCKICDEYIIPGFPVDEPHKCPPAFEILWPVRYGDDEWETVRAMDEQEAVEKWAEIGDAEGGDYSIVGGSPATVFVREKGQETVHKYVVEGQTVPEYSATLREEEEE